MTCALQKAVETHSRSRSRKIRWGESYITAGYFISYLLTKLVESYRDFPGDNCVFQNSNLFCSCRSLSAECVQ